MLGLQKIATRHAIAIQQTMSPCFLCNYTGLRVLQYIMQLRTLPLDLSLCWRYVNQALFFWRFFSCCLVFFHRPPCRHPTYLFAHARAVVCSTGCPARGLILGLELDHIRSGLETWCCSPVLARRLAVAQMLLIRRLRNDEHLTSTRCTEAATRGKPEASSESLTCTIQKRSLALTCVPHLAAMERHGGGEVHQPFSHEFSSILLLIPRIVATAAAAHAPLGATGRR